MGYALAEAAFNTGHKVTLISASDLQPPVGIDFVGVESAEDMFNAVKKFFNRCDCLIMAAAVADYTPARPAKSKLKKSGKPITLKLKPTADILKWAGSHKKGKQIVVGFALEDKTLRIRADKKMKEKNLDMIIANAPGAIGATKSTVLIKAREGNWKEIAKATKSIIAGYVIRQAENLLR